MVYTVAVPFTNSNPYKHSVLFCGTLANEVDPDQTPQNEA